MMLVLVFVAGVGGCSCSVLCAVVVCCVLLVFVDGAGCRCCC